MRIYTSPWLFAKDTEIDILATLEEYFEKCPPPPPLDQFLDTRLAVCELLKRAWIWEWTGVRNIALSDMPTYGNVKFVRVIDLWIILKCLLLANFFVRIRLGTWNIAMDYESVDDIISYRPQCNEKIICSINCMHPRIKSKQDRKLEHYFPVCLRCYSFNFQCFDKVLMHP